MLILFSFLLHILVRYIPLVTIRDKKCPFPVTREQVWSHTKKMDEKEIGVYHPENDGYCVVSIQKGTHKTCMYSY